MVHSGPDRLAAQEPHTNAEPSAEAKLLAYEHAHETAVSLGFPSLTEALEELENLMEWEKAGAPPC